MDYHSEKNNLPIRYELGSYESNGREKSTDNFYVDVTIDGEIVPIKIKPKTSTFTPILKQRLNKGDTLEMQCDGLQSFRNGGDTLQFYSFYTKVKVNGILRKCPLKIAQGEQKTDKNGNTKVNSSFERSLILEAMNIENVFTGDVYDEDEV